MAIIEGKVHDWSRGSMCPRWRQRQSIDLFTLNVSIHSVGQDKAVDVPRTDGNGFIALAHFELRRKESSITYLLPIPVHRGD